MKKITVNASIAATQQKVWDYYTLPEHITKWNFAHPSWHCPSASNDLKIGGLYHARMEAVDGSFGFDFDAIYTEINIGSNFTYGFAGRVVSVELRESNSTQQFQLALILKLKTQLNCKEMAGRQF
jgi:uncharacterized protein YndB with AHSA1/START domain